MVRKTKQSGRGLARRIAVAALGTMLAVWGAHAPAQAAEQRSWTVSEVEGSARMLYNGTGWSTLSKGDSVRPGSRVETGGEARLVLVRPGDSIDVAANSRFDVPLAGGTAGKGPKVHVLQTMGTLLFKITTRPDDPFKVNTPYLAAVIKGTTFTVTVDESSRKSALHVSKGAVEVTSIGSGQAVMVRPGMTAAIDGARGGAMRLIGAKRSDASGAKSGGGKAAAPVEKAGKSDSAGKMAKPVGNGRIDIVKVTKGLVSDLDRPGRASGRGHGDSAGKGKAGSAALGGDRSGKGGLAAVGAADIGAKAKGLGNSGPGGGSGGLGSGVSGGGNNGPGGNSGPGNGHGNGNGNGKGKGNNGGN